MTVKSGKNYRRKRKSLYQDNLTAILPFFCAKYIADRLKKKPDLRYNYMLYII